MATNNDAMPNHVRHESVVCPQQSVVGVAVAVAVAVIAHLGGQQPGPDDVLVEGEDAGQQLATHVVAGVDQHWRRK